MNIYNIIKWYHRIDSPRIKLLGILALHVFKRRYLYIALDPSLACNLRCRMCYFSNPERAKELRGVFSEEDIRQIAKAIFHRGLKLQIGDGAEPTTFKGLAQLVKTAHDYAIPYISISTNGNLLSGEQLQQLADNGLHELILSTHGLNKQTYEHMMRNADFDHFRQLVAAIGRVKQQHPDLKFRVNFTMCADNIDSLRDFQAQFREVKPDILQLRPVQDTGSTAYSNYSMDELIAKYDSIIKPLTDYCEANGITCLYPQLADINAIETENQASKHTNTTIEMLPYFYLAPYEGWKDKLDPYKEDFEGYSRRTHRCRFMLRYLFGLEKDRKEENVTKALNYSIK